ncbi:MAG: lipopolysaccharide biosynthesis protein [Deltaproteobacteria bacterium]|nr:lipopolysaccharide biosynthesis protein [Deltaproteobacteria bacterium]
MNNKLEEIDLLEYWRVLKKRKAFIAVIVLTAFIGSIIVSLMLPKSYRASTSILPPQEEGILGAAMASRLSAGAAGGLAGSLMGLKSASDLWVRILKSQSVTDSIIERFGLKKGDGDTIENARQGLEGRVEIKNSKEQIITIAVFDRDPVLAAKIANAFVEELDRVNRGLVMTGGQRTRVFLEKRLTEAKAELARLENATRGFQEGSGAVRLDAQSKAIIDVIGAVKGQAIAKEVELQTLLSYATPENPEVMLRKTELEELRKRQIELEQGKSGNGIFIPTNSMPKLSVEYARLMRDLKVQETLFELLTQQYEMSKIQEAKDSPTVQVLDVAKPPEKKSRPRRSLIVIATTFLTSCGAIVFAFLLELLERRREIGA